MFLKSSVKLWLWAVVCLLAVQVIASALLPPSYFLTSIVDWISLLLIGSAAASFGRNALASTGQQRVAWALLSGGYAIEAAGQISWMYYELILRTTPKMSVSDVLIFIAWTALIAGFALRPHLEATKQHRRIGMLDLILLLSSWLYLYLFLVVPWQYVVRDEMAQGVAYKFLSLAEDVVLLTVVLLAWRQTSGLWRRFYLLLSCIVAFDTVMEYLVDSAISANQFFTGSWYDLTSSLGIAGMTVAALLGRGLEPGAESDDPGRERYWQWTSRLATPVILILPILAGWSFLDRNLPAPVWSFRVLLTLGAMIVMGFVATLKQVRLQRELARANSELLEASLTDLLTGVRNRRFFNHSVEADVQQALRSFSANAPADAHNRDLIFYLIDFDHFKRINDRFGHHVGDQVLVQIARRVSSAVRLSDALIRWGGEEFLVLSRYTDRKEAQTLAKRLLDAVGGEPYHVGDKAAGIIATCSIGWAAFPLFPKEPGFASHEQVLALADRALYDAKHSGRNQAVGLLTANEDPPKITGAADVVLDAIPVARLVTRGPQVPPDLITSHPFGLPIMVESSAK